MVRWTLRHEMGDNAALTAAKRAKKDEFYTQRVDIENELRHYKAHFKGKVVLCNCDDPRQSEFFKYFVENFEKLGLKRLIATCYKSQASGRSARSTKATRTATWFLMTTRWASAC